MLAQRSHRWCFSNKDSRGSCVKGAILKRLYGIGSLLMQLVCMLFEALYGLLLRAGAENSVEEVFHLVVAIGGRTRPSTLRWKWAWHRLQM